MLLLIVAIFIVLILIIYTADLIMRRCRLYFYAFKIPGPVGVPFFGSALQFLKSGETFFEKLMEWSDKYKPICKVWLGSDLYIILSKPHEIELVMKNYLKKENNIYNIIEPLMSDGIFLAPVNRWKTHRKLLNQTFGENILNSQINILTKHANKMVVNLQNIWKEQDIDIFQIFYLSNTNIIHDAFLGVNFNDLDKEENYINWNQSTFTLLSKRLLTPLHHISFLWRLSKSASKVSNLKTKLEAHCRNVFEARKLVKFRENDAKMLDFLIKMADKGVWSEKQVLGEIQTMLVAGTDTVAITLSFAAVVLALKQDIQEKVYKELYSIFADSDRDVTVEDLHKMVYLECFIKETQRLFPAATVLVRTVDKDIIFDAYRVPEGSTLMIPIRYIHKNPEYWPNPLKFDPDRFLPEEIKKRPRYAYMPFGIPPRNCIGWKFAMITMKVLLSTVLRRFRFISAQYQSTEKIKLEFQLLLTASNGYKVRMEPRITY